jgi:glycosyltransferase involved in cell wall biosynthesis
MLFLYSDVLFSAGGVESYLHALALHLHQEKIPFRVAVAELATCPLIDDLLSRGILVYRQRRWPGDRWLIRQRFLLAWLMRQLKPADLVFCVRQPVSQLYWHMVSLVHRHKARLAASWALAPEFVLPSRADFIQAVAETDVVISVSRCTVNQFKSLYGYDGPVHVVPYHNLSVFDRPLPLPAGPPWKIGYLGRLEMRQKNLDQLITAFGRLVATRPDIELHLHGHGPDQSTLEHIVHQERLHSRVFFHGSYDHRRDLPSIMARCHFFVYPSRFEGGPCFTLLELMQAGRYCVASRVGGIPDLYEGHPEAGLLVTADDTESLRLALEQAIRCIESNSIQPFRVRERYSEHFDMKSAHRAWMKALALSG